MWCGTVMTWTSVREITHKACIYQYDQTRDAWGRWCGRDKIHVSGFFFSKKCVWNVTIYSVSLKKNHLECVRHVNYLPMSLWQIEVVQFKSDNCAFICRVFGVKQGSMIFLQRFNIIYWDNSHCQPNIHILLSILLKGNFFLYLLQVI